MPQMDACRRGLVQTGALGVCCRDQTFSVELVLGSDPDLMVSFAIFSEFSHNSSTSDLGVVALTIPVYFIP